LRDFCGSTRVVSTRRLEDTVDTDLPTRRAGRNASHTDGKPQMSALTHRSNAPSLRAHALLEYPWQFRRGARTPGDPPTHDEKRAIRRDGERKNKPRVFPRRHTGVAPSAMTVVLALGLLAGCAIPRGSSTGRDSALVYVANSRDHTITQLEATNGQVIGPPLPAGFAPGPVVVGRNGDLLTMSWSAGHEGYLTLIARGNHTRTTSKLLLEPQAQALSLAGNGGRYAVVAYVVRTSGRRSHSQPCRLARIDLIERTVAPGVLVCTGGEVASGLALEEGPLGPIAYVALWREGGTSDGPIAVDAGRMVARNPVTGETLGALPLAGIPGDVVFGPDPWGTGRRLFVVYAEDDGDGSARDDIGTRFNGASGWHLLAVEPHSMTPERAYPLRFAPRRLTVAPDGRHAYASSSSVGSTTVWHIDLTTGTTNEVVRLPGSSLGLAVTQDHLFVSDTDGRSVWLIDRQSGRPFKKVPVGRNPLGIAVGL
jgi:hypothetical protein